MKMLPALGFMALVIYLIWPAIEKNYVDLSTVPQFNWRNDPSRKQKAKKAMPQAKPVKAIAKTDAVSSETAALIKQVGRKYGVPSGALYGIWYVESSRLPSGWGNGTIGWYRAADLVKPGGQCIKEKSKKISKEKSKAWCDRQWRALAYVCAQKKNGQAICDPDEVYTSWALAMGPMQQLPTELVKFSPQGAAAWGERVVDYDGDGVRDPHALPDAMAMTAASLKLYYVQYGSWQKAINRYYGSQTEGYMEGTTDGRKGVVDHWKVWCDRYDRCGGTMTVASAD